MSKQIIHVPNAPRPLAPYSPAVVANGFIFASGQIAINPSSNQMVQDSISAETHQVMQNVAAVLAAAGSEWDKVVKATIFLTDMNDYATVNEIYGQYFNKETAPARECIQVSRLPKDARVEISVIALV